MKTTYNKLVRDRIPEYLKKKGLVVKSRVAPKSEHRKFIREKLLEEVAELLRARGKEEILGELADTMEVLETFAKIEGISPTKLNAKKKTKRKERGGFSNYVILRTVEE